MRSNSTLRSAILRATDGKLRADNWQYLIDVCDLVKEDPEDGGQLAVEIVQERLNEQDANVILRTLSLVVSLAENCGSRLQQAVSSKSFTKQLLSVIDNPGVHWIVKTEIAKTVTQLSDSFKHDPSLKAMQDLKKKIQDQNPDLLEKQDVPQKSKLSEESQRNEEKELEEALRLSILEYKNRGDNSKIATTDNGQAHSSQTRASTTALGPLGQTSTAVRKVRALHDLNGRDSEELSFRNGDVISVIEKVYRDWWRGSLRGKVGIFPLNYVTPVAEKSSHEQEEDRVQEAMLLDQVSKVEELHAIMRGSHDNFGVTQDQNVTDLYSSITPLRPQLTKLIGTYAQQREDYSSLRKILADAEASYNQLLDRASQVYTTPQAQQFQPSRTSLSSQQPHSIPQLQQQSQAAVTQVNQQSPYRGYVHAQSFLTGEGPQQDLQRPYSQSRNQQHGTLQPSQSQQAVSHPSQSPQRFAQPPFSTQQEVSMSLQPTYPTNRHH
ncbi:LADA_0G11188g1_1 [Lachancea dasiensis]|uniref:Class E vacuolar protein-sorting machinery protein HSE1 n=1 Tax=Lachancea dasiensis TaxID=1072105 RepID=A0A1G4JUY7_9SACH|nr:LADA_0G11188g1_1 [Lachancea dasiensis]